MESHQVLSKSDKYQIALKIKYHTGYNIENELEQSFPQNAQLVMNR